MSASERLAVTYHRVSTIDQDSAAARTELRAACAARGLTIVEEVEETGSGAKADRPGLLRAMELATTGKVGAVVVWKLDRFGRSALDLLGNVEALVRTGARFVAVTQGLDVQEGGDPTSKLTLTILSGVAEWERAVIRERTRMAIDGRRREVKLKGGFVGRKSRVWRRRLGRPGLSEEKQAEIRKLRFEGHSPIYAIARVTDVPASTVRQYVRRMEQEGAEKGGAKPCASKGENTPEPDGTK